MNVLEAIDTLRQDLDRTIESLEALRTGFANYALAAPELDKPRAPLPAPAPDRRLREFLNERTRRGANAYVRVSDLWDAYQRWAKLNGARGLGLRHFNARIAAAAGASYSRSRRIRGVQARTWEGIALAPRRNAKRETIQ